jgi:hypothetical protein
MKKDPLTLMLLTIAKSLQSLGYILKIYAVKDGEARSIWETIVGQVPVLRPEKFDVIDWTGFEGVIADSLEAEGAISRYGIASPLCWSPLALSPLYG